MRYKKLEDMIADRGIRKTVIAKTLGISERALRYKIDGETSFSWEQACAVQEKFFPDVDLKILFGRCFPDEPKEVLFSTDDSRSDGQKGA